MTLVILLLVMVGLALGGSRYVVHFDNQTQIVVLGSAHQLETSDIQVTCYTAFNPIQVVEPDSITIDSSLFDVTITFATPQSGKCVLR